MRDAIAGREKIQSIQAYERECRIVRVLRKPAFYLAMAVIVLMWCVV